MGVGRPQSKAWIHADGWYASIEQLQVPQGRVTISGLAPSLDDRGALGGLRAGHRRTAQEYDVPITSVATGRFELPTKGL